VSRLTAALVAAALAVPLLAACGGGGGSDAADGPLVVYSGRSEELVGPLFAQFTNETGIPVEARYGDSAELAAQLVEEGDRTPAQVFFAQDAGALGAVAGAGLFAQLPAAAATVVPPNYRSTDGTWTGVSGRARVIAYDPRQVSEAEVPDSIFDLTDPTWKGKVGIAPTNASFQAFVTAMRVSQGDEVTQQWLEGLVANDAQTYEKNALILDAVDSGQIALGLINHYYLYEKIAEVGAESVNAANHYFAEGDAGSLVNVAGVGILASSDQQADAQKLVDYFLSEAGQTYFAETTFEYPLVAGVAIADALKPLDEVQGPDISLGQLSDVAATQEMLARVGLI